MHPLLSHSTASINSQALLDALLTVDVLAPIGAGVGAFLLYYVLGSRYLGPDDEFWRPLRQTALPLLDKLFARAFDGYALNNSTEAEYAGYVDMRIDDFEIVLHDQGFARNPWSGLKRSPDRRFEHSSWALRRVQDPVSRGFLDLLEGMPVAGDVLETIEALLATRQIHVTLYARPGGGVDVYAHEEANSVSPLVAVEHYEGVGQDIEAGVEWMRERFPRLQY